MKKLLLTLFSVAFITPFLAQANTKFNLVNDAYYGGPTIEGWKLRYKLGVLLENPENEGYSHLHLGKVVGPTGLRTEFFITDRIGLGTDAIYNYTSGRFSKQEVEFNTLTGMNDTSLHVYEFTNNHVRIQARINFHKKVKSKKLDVYTGLGFGSNGNVVKLKRDNKEVSPGDFLESKGLRFSARACFGFRWYPVKPVGINFELGFGGPLVSAGASSRLAFKLPKVPELTAPDEDSDNLKRKKDALQEKQNMEEQQEKLKSKAREATEGEELKSKSNSMEKEKQKLEEEKLKLEQEKLELEREKLELEKKKFEEEKKEHEKRKEP